MASPPAIKSPDDAPDLPVTDPAKAVDAAAQKEQVPPATHMAAVDWFMDEECLEQETQASAVVPVDVAPAGRKPRIVEFTMQVLDRDFIKQIREENTKTLGDGTRETDDMEANLRMVVESMIDPPIRTDERLRTVRGQRYLDPGEALKARFAHKPGVIDLLAAKVTEIAGYDGSNVREVRAAGN